MADIFINSINGSIQTENKKIEGNISLKNKHLDGSISLPTRVYEKDYEKLDNLPKINGVTLIGDKTTDDLNIQIPSKTSELINDNNYISDENYTHTDNNFTTELKDKLDNIEIGAEANQNAFSQVKVGDQVISAQDKTDLLELSAGNNVTLTADKENNKLTITALANVDNLIQDEGTYFIIDCGSASEVI